MFFAASFFDKLTECDHNILDFIAVWFRSGFGDAVMPVVTFFGEAWFPILCAFLFLCFKKTRKTGASVAVALILGLLVCNLGLKPLVHRIRPYDLWDVDITLIKKPTDFSFPSGHTIASFEMAVVLLQTERKRFGWAALLLAILISFSRLYLYVHYPSDVFASVILGSLFAVIAVKLVDFVYKKKQWN